MIRGFSILLLMLTLQAPAFGESSSGFVLQDIVDKFRDGYQAILQHRDDTYTDKKAISPYYGNVSRRSRYSGNGVIKSTNYTTYEYVTNGVLMHIKVIPEDNRRGLAAGLLGRDAGIKIVDDRGGTFARPYYMSPADGSPHYADLKHQKRLYPRWVITEF